MGLPEPFEPEPESPETPSKGADRADWLCGPEEGLEAELGRTHRESGAAPAPKLFRPGADAPTDPAPSQAPPRRNDPPPVRLTLPSAPAGPAPPAESAPPAPRRGPGAVDPETTEQAFSHGPAMLWEPGANSVPALPRSGPAPAAPATAAAPAASPLDFPMDDAEERARATVEAAAAAAAATERASQPHAVVAPDAFDLQDAPVPWWMRVPQLLREDRRAQGIAAGVVVLLLALAFWPRAEKALSIASLRRDAAHYDGRDVRVSGRVGEIFTVGGGYAFYLHQGRDTLVVFTRTRTPRRGERLSLVGMVSTGYLNGQSGTALFESSGAGK